MANCQYFRSPPKTHEEALDRLDELQSRMNDLEHANSVLAESLAESLAVGSDINVPLHSQMPTRPIQVSQIWLDVFGNAELMSIGAGKNALGFWIRHLQGCIEYPRDKLSVLILRLRSHVMSGRPMETFPSYEVLSDWVKNRVTGREIRKCFLERQDEIWTEVNTSLLDNHYPDDHNPKEVQDRDFFLESYGKGLEDNLSVDQCFRGSKGKVCRIRTERNDRDKHMNFSHGSGRKGKWQRRGNPQAPPHVPYGADSDSDSTMAPC